MTTNRKKLTADLIASVSFLGFAIFVYALSVGCRPKQPDS